MKKLIALFMVMAMLMSVAACGQPDNATAPAGSSTSGSTAPSGDSKPGGEKEKLVYLCMNLGDLSFNDDGWSGCQKVAEKYNMEASVIELGIDTSTFEVAFLDACDSGEYDYLVTQSNQGLSDYVIKYAKNYPDMKFICFDIAAGTALNADNVTGIAYEQNDGSFLAGVVAAGMSKSGKIGAITGNDVPVLNDFFVGFIEGARTVNPKATINIAYTNSWDTAKFQEVTSTMYQAGLDVIFGLGGIGVFNGCIEEGGIAAGKYIIGVDMDQWAMYQNSENPELAEVIITSMLKCVGNSIIACFDQMNAGDDIWNKVILQGIPEGAIGLAKNEYYEKMVPKEIRDKVEEYEAKIVSGELNPVSYFDFESYEKFAEFRSNAEK